jgi:prolyl 4-hydroxylase
MIPASHGEAFNVLRYEQLQHYDSHMDTFDPKVSAPEAKVTCSHFMS